MLKDLEEVVLLQVLNNKAALLQVLNNKAVLLQVLNNKVVLAPHQVILLQVHCLIQ